MVVILSILSTLKFAPAAIILIVAIETFDFRDNSSLLITLKIPEMIS